MNWKTTWFVLPTIFALLIVSQPAQSQTPDLNVTINSIPKNAEEFGNLRDQIATTPQGGIVMLVLALKMYGENEKEGLAAMVMALDRSQLEESGAVNAYMGFLPGRSVQYHLNRLGDTLKYLPNSYFLGTGPDNGYALDGGPYRFEITRNRFSGDESDGEVKYFIRSTGADSPRPVRVVRNNRGIWKAKEFSSIVVGVRPPAQNVDDNI